MIESCLDHIPNNSNQEGAKRLKQKIETYWKGRGYDVEVKLVDHGYVPAMRAARVDVRSELINGLPKALLEKARKRDA